MSALTQQDIAWHARYEAFTPDDKDAADDAYNSCRAALMDHGVLVANDDRAEALVAAIARYMIESAV